MYLFPSSGLISHLKSHFPHMYWLYCILKAWAEPPTAQEITIASGEEALNPASEVEYIKKLEAASENICKAFAAQVAQAAVCSPLLFSPGMPDIVQ